MRQRTKSTLVLGVAGGLAFLVLIQAATLLGTPNIAIALGTKLGLAVVAGVITAGVNYALETWLARSERA